MKLHAYEVIDNICKLLLIKLVEEGSWKILNGSNSMTWKKKARKVRLICMKIQNIPIEYYY